MIKSVVICDVCSTVKNETNHWFRIFQFMEKGELVELKILPYSNNSKVQQESFISPAKDICGKECLHKIVDKLLGEKLK